MFDTVPEGVLYDVYYLSNSISVREMAAAKVLGVGAHEHRCHVAMQRDVQPEALSAWLSL